MATDDPHPLLWLTDRSRYQTGTAECPQRRYLTYHYHGIGLERLAQSIPLATGTYVHQPITDILTFHQQGARSDPHTFYRTAIAKTLADYRASVDERSIRNLTEGDDLAYLVAEQCALIEGLTWIWIRLVLPWILEQFEILAVETEEVFVGGCTCGIGDSGGVNSLGLPANTLIQAHAARGCQGVGFMSRPDFLTRDRASHLCQYHELKTVGMVGPLWLDQWETSMQFAVGIKGAEARLGERIDQMYVHGLVKGQRGNDYNPATGKYDLPGPRRQNSICCHAYCKPPNPPLWEADWQPSWKYTGTDGKNHTLGKGYDKQPLFSWTHTDVEGARRTLGTLTLPGKPETLSNVEYWITGLDEAYLTKAVCIVGPLPRQDWIVERAMAAIVAHEQEVQAKCEYIRQTEAEAGYVAGREASWAYFPPSWVCRRYGADHRCEHEPVCFGPVDRDPMSTNLYRVRQPHHAPEAEQWGDEQ